MEFNIYCCRVKGIIVLQLIVVNNEELKSSDWLLLLRNYSFAHGHAASTSSPYLQTCAIKPVMIHFNPVRMLTAALEQKKIKYCLEL